MCYILNCDFFTGLHDQGVESEFQWSDGTVVQYTNWDNWNPNNWANSEDCANVRSYNDGRWNDQNCRNSLPYICKKPKGLPFGCAHPSRLIFCEFVLFDLMCGSWLGPWQE